MRNNFRIKATGKLEAFLVRMTSQIHIIGTIWAGKAERSLATLGTKLTNDSRFFVKMAEGGTCTTKTFEKFLSFFRDDANWPDNVIPQGAVELLDNFENIASSASADPAECHGGDAAASGGGDASVTSFDVSTSLDTDGDGFGHADSVSGAADGLSTGHDGQLSRELAVFDERPAQSEIAA